MNRLPSVAVSTAASSGAEKLGQPVPLSNFAADEKSGWPQPAQVNVPSRFSPFNALEPARSVPCPRCGWAEIFPIVDRRVASEVCPMFFQLGTGDMLRNVFEAAGVTEVRIERISAMIEYASADDAVGAAFAGGPVALAYSRFEAPVRNEVHAEYLDSLAPYRAAGGAGYEVPGEFVVARGVRA